jgi:hypothetical protein
VRRVPVLQGVYFLFTGFWPLLSMRSFEAVTGPKVGVGSAAALGGVEVVYALRGRISRIYLAAAVVETVLVALWASEGRRRRLIF